MRAARSTKRWWPSALGGVCLLLASAAGAQDSKINIEKLTHLVRQDCGGCHGLTLKGGLGKPLTPEHLAQWDREQLVHIILDGVPGTPMPGWRPLMSEADARWIADTLKRGKLQ